MESIISFISNPWFKLSILAIIGVFLFVWFLRRYHFYYGNFGEGNVYKSLKKLYDKNDYPFIRQIILPVNAKSYAYYDAIVFGDKFIYNIEIKNHNGYLVVDPLDKWIFIDKNAKEITIPNAFYELEVKTHILNRYLEINPNKIINVCIYNKNTKIKGVKGRNQLINVKQIHSFINYFESIEDEPKIPISFIESKGNFVVSHNMKKLSKRRSVISRLKYLRIKR